MTSISAGSLAKRIKFLQERSYCDNLMADLALLKQFKKPEYYDLFFDTYPKKYHSYALAVCWGLTT